MLTSACRGSGALARAPPMLQSGHGVLHRPGCPLAAAERPPASKRRPASTPEPAIQTETLQTNHHLPESRTRDWKCGNLTTRIWVWIDCITLT
eukprot:1480347-Rhodomonas_salina.5